MERDTSSFEYDVCLSFAGAQRGYVREVANSLVYKGVRVFFDEREKVQLWGKDLYSYLDDIYQNLARYCVVFASDAYAKKVWTSHERRSAQARAIREQGEYILPARFDDIPIPGLPDTIGYVDLRETSPEELAELIFQKLGPRAAENFFPPHLDRLFERLGIEDDVEAQKIASQQSYRWYNILQRMNPVERDVVFHAFLHGCAEELPDNIHIYVDLLRRLTGMQPTKLRRVLGGLNSLGFTCSIRESHESRASKKSFGEAPLFEIEWTDLAGDGEYPEMYVAHAVLEGAVAGYCEEHGLQALRRLDFSQLARATTKEDHHP